MLPFFFVSFFASMVNSKEMGQPIFCLFTIP